uniref:Uncharacterized protein n=1 Tax=Rhizophora mucronata TaxID=61149 RepID=A0A2P2P6J5_RHIMU
MRTPTSNFASRYKKKNKKINDLFFFNVLSLVRLVQRCITHYMAVNLLDCISRNPILHLTQMPIKEPKFFTN